VPGAFEKRTALNGDTVDMRSANKTILYASSAAANSFVVDMTSARPGAELLLIVPCSIADTIAIGSYLPGGLGVHMYELIDAVAAVNVGFIYYKLKYVGVDGIYAVVLSEWYNPA